MSDISHHLPLGFLYLATYQKNNCPNENYEYTCILKSNSKAQWISIYFIEISFILFHITIEIFLWFLFANTASNKPSTIHTIPIHFMYEFSALSPVIGRNVSIFFGFCSNCCFITICCDFLYLWNDRFSDYLWLVGTCGYGASICSVFCGCGVCGVGGVDSF
ncbi:TPA: DUF2705 family protein [Bacillus cereus]|nr:DUF2705 family protein [Bacillus cereus]